MSGLQNEKSAGSRNREIQQDLAGKTALVTGASRGIGRAIAIELALRGAFVIINYRGNREKAEEVQKEIEACGSQAALLSWDVADFGQCEEYIKEAMKITGRIDILVNNAGITRDGLIMNMKEEDFDSVLSTNLKGAFNCIRFVSRIMLRQRSGHIVNIASVSGVMGNAGQTNYAASKAGVIGLTKAAARELASRGITVNAIAPGFIATDMTDALSEKVKESVVPQIPLGEFGKPEDVAAAVAFLASDASSYITGQVLCVDGGMAM